MQITIPGKPIAKKRPRFARRGKFVATYNDQQTEEGRFLLTAREQIGGEKLAGPLEVKVAFFMPIPKSTSKKKRKLMLCDSPDRYHTKKPDIDNLVKFALDCLNGEAWGDDAQVVSLGAIKIYSDSPRTVIEINCEA